MNIIQKFKTKNRLSKLLIGGNIPKLQTAWQPLYTEQQRAAIEWGRQNATKTAEQVLTAVQKADEKNSQRQKAYQRANRNTKAPFVNNTAKLQEALFKSGFFDEGTTFNKAVDGIRGGMTNRAIQRAKDAGYNVNIDTGTISKAQVQSDNKFLKTPRQSIQYTDPYTEGIILSNPDNPGDSNLGNGYSRQTGTKIKKDNNSNTGRAIYIHYPNFKGSTANAISINGKDIGKMAGDAVGISTLPVGHAAAILISPEGEGTYYEYGRYTGKPGVPDEYGVSTFGHVRPTVKGGNWRRKKLPNIMPGESDSAYVARLQSSLPNTKTGAYQIMSFPNVNVKKATEYIESQANDIERPTYGPGNTCANGACNSILPFIEGKREYHPLIQEFDMRGYSPGAIAWSEIPMSTGAIAREVRKRANKITIMNQ